MNIRVNSPLLLFRIFSSSSVTRFFSFVLDYRPTNQGTSIYIAVKRQGKLFLLGGKFKDQDTKEQQ
jgi:hypothetical protein